MNLSRYSSETTVDMILPSIYDSPIDVGFSNLKFAWRQKVVKVIPRSITTSTNGGF